MWWTHCLHILWLSCYYFVIGHHSREVTFYEQRKGMAMGSPVSAVVANLYMKFFEELALDTTPVKPRPWKRYVDDTCCIVKKDATEGLLDHLNSVRPSIQLTVEVEKDGMLLFLDTLLRRREDGIAWASLSTGSPPTPTVTWTSSPTAHPMSRGVWSGACMTGHVPSPAPRTTYRRKNTTFPWL